MMNQLRVSALARFFLRSVLLVCSAFAVSAQQIAESLNEIPVLVEHNQQWQGYAERPRLLTVLQLQVKSANVHWPSAKLYNLDAAKITELEQLRQQVLAQLRQLIIAGANDTSFAMQLQETRQQIGRWRLAMPMDMVINPDLAALQQAFNPRLSHGQYLLVATKRVSTVSVFGLGGERYLRHEQLRPAYQYLLELSERNASLPSYAWLLAPSQPPKQIPVGSWNRTETAVSTGAVLFLPLAHELITDEYAQLNQQILTLLAHRVRP